MKCKNSTVPLWKQVRLIQSFGPAMEASTECYFCRRNDPLKLEYEYSPELQAYVCEHCSPKLNHWLRNEFRLQLMTG